MAVEGCIASPLSSDEAHSLQQLLNVFLPKADTGALASAIARLSELLAEDSQSFDTVGAAQRAVHNVISTLKAAKGDAAAKAPASLHVRPQAALTEPLFASTLPFATFSCKTFTAPSACCFCLVGRQCRAVVGMLPCLHARHH
jgi:hypothetical protein